MFEEQLNKFSEWYDSYEDKPSKSNLMGYFTRKNKEMFEAGQKSGMEGKIFKQIEIKEECHIPQKIYDKILEKGLLKGRICKQNEVDYHFQQGKEIREAEIIKVLMSVYKKDPNLINEILNKI